MDVDEIYSCLFWKLKPGADGTQVRDRLRGRFNVAVAELDHQDVWQRATLGIVSISDSQKYLEGLFQLVLAETEKILGDDVADHNIEYL